MAIPTWMCMIWDTLSPCTQCCNKKCLLSKTQKRVLESFFNHWLLRYQQWRRQIFQVLPGLPADQCRPTSCIQVRATVFPETFGDCLWQSNFVKIHQASWKLSIYSGHWNKGAGIRLSQHIWHFALISISECTITCSLFFSQLLTPSVSTPRIACWCIYRVLPLLHVAVLLTVPLPSLCLPTPESLGIGTNDKE